MIFEDSPLTADISSRAVSPAGQNATVVVAMSGGVDSSTAAAILRSSGCRVIGLTMQLWDQRRLASDDPSAPKTVEGRCCSLNDVYDARRVAEHLHVPYYVVNFERNFEQAVIRPFVSEYFAGRTPIPCTLCNNHVKFDQLLVTARQIGADLLATGHYARVEFDQDRQRYLLRRAVDETKDQSYFLFGLTQQQLSRTLFPLGSIPKQKVREIARENRLPVAEKPESQEICFVPGGDYTRFLEAYQREQGDPLPETEGDVTTADGRVLARHNGLHHFTVGQRKGLGVATGTPLYVISLDPASRRVVVGGDEELYAGSCLVRDVNWIAIPKLESEQRVEVKIRHKHIPAPATVVAEGDAVRVRFEAPQRALTPGQAAVFYQGDLVVGGGWIDRVGR
jgi:tRNA-uridine 2-sulfurtransferase